MAGRSPADQLGTLGITAVYTAQVARWGGLRGAELFDLPAGRVVFWMTNLVTEMARLLVPRAAPLAVSILHRQACIDEVLRRAGVRRLLELACGLSRRGIAFTDGDAGGGPGLEAVLVDLPAMIAFREELLSRTEAGRAVLSRPRLRVVAADVVDADLDAIAPAGPDLAVVAEGLCMYLDAVQQRNLWRRVADLLRARGGGVFVFDLVPGPEQPAPGRVGRFLGWLMSRFTGGQGMVHDDRDRRRILAELVEAGFDEVECREPAEVAAAWSLPRPEARSQQLVFIAGVRPGAGGGVKRS
ncbi:MAG: hypothetical protein D6798_04795 [Deltaproteobacteria bacterium]|nr:MAG: hypothetical protein D6798_04795 [Deltaproteobacteria bacterium]